MKNKTVIITGASSGIGLSVAELFAKKEFTIILLARTEDKLKGLCSKINKFKPNSAFCYRCDLSNTKNISEVTEQIKRKFKKIDILINNAGIGFPTDLSEIRIEEYNRIMDTNIKGVVFLTKEIIKIMQQHNQGHIINISSMAGIESNSVAPIYCTSKFALEGYTSGLRKQLKEKKLKIRVSLIRPGGVDTNYWGKRDVNRKLFMTPQEMAQVIHFVASFPEKSNVVDITMESFR